MKGPVGDVARVVPQVASADINTASSAGDSNRLDAETSPGQLTGPSPPLPPNDFQTSTAKKLITTSSRGSISNSSQARPIRHQTTKELLPVTVPSSYHSNSCSGYSSTGVHRCTEGDADRWAQQLWEDVDEGSGQSGSPSTPQSASASVKQRARVQALVEHVWAASEGPLQLPELKRYLPPGHPVRDITGGSRESAPVGGDASRASEAEAGGGGATDGGGDLGGELAGEVDGLGPHYPFGPLEARQRECSKSAATEARPDQGDGGGAISGRSHDYVDGRGERGDSGRILAAASEQTAGIRKESQRAVGGNSKNEPDAQSVGPVAPRAKQAWARLEAAQGGVQPAVDAGSIAGSIGGGSSIMFGTGSTAGSIVVPSSISRGITPGALASMEAFVRRERERERELEAEDGPGDESQGGQAEEESYGSEGGYDV